MLPTPAATNLLLPRERWLSSLASTKKLFLGGIKNREEAIITKCALGLFFLIMVVALALPADARDRRLYDPHEPGSVIVFPEFVRGSVPVDGVSLPSTEIEVGVMVCILPKDPVIDPITRIP
jgi:hypothetical protein